MGMARIANGAVMRAARSDAVVLAANQIGKEISADMTLLTKSVHWH